MGVERFPLWDEVVGGQHPYRKVYSHESGGLAERYTPVGTL